MPQKKTPPTLPNLRDEALSESSSEEPPRKRRPKKIRTIQEQILGHEARLEYLRRKEALGELKTSPEGRQIDALLKAKNAVTEVGEDKIADDLETVIQRWADEYEIDLP